MGLIIAVEGPSAAGKTTWCRRYAARHLVGETEAGAFASVLARPATALFAAWQTENERRWALAEAQESDSGMAVCDTDPLKLHYIWSLWQAGHAPESEWQYAAGLARVAFESGSLGIADQVLVADLPEGDLRRRRAGDLTRRRRGFELHAALRRPLRSWYEAVAALDPRRVLFELPESGLQDPRLARRPREPRTGKAIFDGLISEVMGRSDPLPPVDEADWYRRNTALLEDTYLGAADPPAGSGKSGGVEAWELARNVIIEAVHRSGTFLDIGCANGLLMESMVPWAAARGHLLEPYGLDLSGALAEVARVRLPRWSDRIFAGNAMTWEPPRRFDFVRTELTYVPFHRREEYVRRLLSAVVAPGGRLMVCAYGSARRPEVPAESAAGALTEMGLPIAGQAEAFDPAGRTITRIAWTDSQR